MAISNQSYPNNRLLRPSEVAEILNISRALAYRLLKKGQIPSIRFNSSVRVSPRDLEAYIQQCRFSPNDLGE